MKSTHGKNGDLTKTAVEEVNQKGYDAVYRKLKEKCLLLFDREKVVVEEDRKSFAFLPSVYVYKPYYVAGN